MTLYKTIATEDGSSTHVALSAEEEAAVLSAWAETDAANLAQVPANVRAERDRRLLASDWRVIKATETGEPLPGEWASYRQALRDITLQPGFPESITWPTEPQ